MIAFLCYMLNGQVHKVYAYAFIKQDQDAAFFDIGTNSEYVLYGVDHVGSGGE